MAKHRVLTLEVLRVMDTVDRCSSFVAAVDELARVPSASAELYYAEIDIVLFNPAGHQTKFTNVDRMLLGYGQVLLEAADKLTTDAEALLRG